VRKKSTFILHNNEIIPQPDTEINGIDDMDAKAAAQYLQDNKYVGIEDCLKPTVFYELCGLLKDDTFKNKSKRFNVSQFHGVSIEVLMDSGFIEAKKADLMRGLVATGLLSLRIKGGVNPEGTENTLQKVAALSSRISSNTDYLESLLNLLKVEDNGKSRAFLRKIVSKYGNNQYGSRVLQHITDATRTPEKPAIYKKVTNPLSKTGAERCETISNERLTDKMYVVEDGKEEKLYCVDINMSQRFWILLAEYKKSHFSSGTHSQLLRACTVTGLFCLSKWLLKSKICKDETNFYALCQAIQKYGVDKF
jgi:hypothetical protein